MLPFVGDAWGAGVQAYHLAFPPSKTMGVNRPVPLVLWSTDAMKTTQRFEGLTATKGDNALANDVAAAVAELHRPRRPP